MPAAGFQPASGSPQIFNNLRWAFDRARVLQDPLFASYSKRADVDVGRRTGVPPHDVLRCFPDKEVPV